VRASPSLSPVSVVIRVASVMTSLLTAVVAPPSASTVCQHWLQKVARSGSGLPQFWHSLI
jgi:hypothetical protein